VSLKVCYRWTVDSYKAQEMFLLAILPYLVIKREQALLALEFVRMLGVKDPVRRMHLHQRMIATNRGESPTTNTPNCTESVQKIESGLTGDRESGPAVTQVETSSSLPA
jgi:hypothetical protein